VVRGLASAFLILAGKNSSLISADEVEISSRLPYKSRVGLVVVMAETKNGVHHAANDDKYRDRFSSRGNR